MKLLAGGDGITDAEVSRVRQTDDVACEGLFYRLLTLSHEGRWAAELQALAEAHVLVARIALEATGADLDEGDTAAVVGIHVRMDLEDKASEGGFVRRYLTLLGLDRAGRWSDLYEAVEELLHTEVVECRAEEHGGDIARQIFFAVKLGVYAVDELQIHTELLCLLGGDVLLKLGGVEVCDRDALRDALLVGCEEIECPLVDVVDATEALPHVDGPRERAYTYLQLLLDLIK